MNPEYVAIPQDDLVCQLSLINEYFPLTELYSVCRDLKNNMATMIVEKTKFPDYKTTITIKWG